MSSDLYPCHECKNYRHELDMHKSESGKFLCKECAEKWDDVYVPAYAMTYDSREAGMHLHITVACQQCDDGFINTPALTADRARDCVESLGWVFVPDLGWTCEDCAHATR